MGDSTSDQKARGSDVSRRGFLRLAGGAALAGTALPLILEACGSSAAPAGSSSGSAPASVSASPSASVASSGASAAASASAAPSTSNPLTVPINPKNAKALPNYFAEKLLAPPDFNAHDPRVTIGYSHYPKNPVKSWTKAPPGDASTINVFLATLYPPPTPYASNPTWHEVNTQLNANVQMQMVAPQDYATKLATTMAGGNLPDIMSFFLGIQAAPNLPEFFKAQMQDLTPYLAGDAIKAYPHLANIPTYAWNNSASAIDGQLFTWPIHRYLPGLSYFFKNTDVWDQKVGKTTNPTNSTDLRKLMEQVNNPKGNQWAIGNIARAPFNFGIAGYAQMFGAPQFWGFDANSKLVRDWETPEYKAAISYVADLWKAGLIWPDAPSASDSRSNFVGKKFVMSVEGFGNSWNDFWYRGLYAEHPPTHFDIILPFSADAKTKVQSYISGGYINTVAMKKASPDRVKMILGVMDWLAAPFGTQEQELLFYGLKGKDYNADAQGDPHLINNGKLRSQYVPWQYISAPPYVEYYADIPGYAARVFPIEKALVDPKIAVSDATLGYYSPTDHTSQATAATTKMTDGINNIVLGRAPLSGWDGLVTNWKSSIGDKIRGEYLSSMGKA